MACIKLPGLLALLLGFLFAAQSQAAPRADLWSYWLKSDESASLAIDHGDWQTFLSEYVHADNTGMNRVNYSAVTRAHRTDLDAYLRRQSKLSITGYPRAEQLAFWINLYNALTVKVILDHYPVQSIQAIDISPGWFSAGPWGKKLLTIEGRALSLDDIEHRILRPIWKDSRIHYAVNCASVGCPDLSQTAYNGAHVVSELIHAAQRYVNHPRGVTVLHGQVQVSSLYKWFKNDFGGSEMAILDHLRQYASGKLKYKLENVSDISGYAYDWALNDLRNDQPGDSPT